MGLMAPSFESSDPKRVLIITGESGSGKTARLLALIAGFRAEGLSVGGLISRSERDGAIKTAYFVEDLESGESRRYAALQPGSGGPNDCRYDFFDDGFQFGNLRLMKSRADVLVLDEVGSWEVKDGGFAPAVTWMLTRTGTRLVFIVKLKVLERFLAKFPIASTELSIERL